MNANWCRTALTLTVGMSALSLSAIMDASAQAPTNEPMQPGASEGEIVVTARRRSENLMTTPIVASTVSAAEIERRGITDLESVARVVPNLVIAGASGSIQGGAVGMRGISAGESNPLGDQAVAFNVDGVQVARAGVRRMGEFDTSQIEVLRGPQALFFGKNSPAGIVILHSADPTSSFEAGGTIGYEVNAEQVRGEGFISGPITSTLGARLALFASEMDGWVDNETPASALNSPSDRSAPKPEEFGGRLTLAFTPSDFLDAKLKYTFGEVEDTGAANNTQRVRCPFGAPQIGIGTNDDCKANDTVVRADLGPTFGTLHPIFGDGVPYARQIQQLGSLEVNFHLTPHLTLSSQTGVYLSRFKVVENFNANSGDSVGALTAMLASAADLSIEEDSQEFRLTSENPGRFNFMLGAFYQESNIRYISVTARNANAPTHAGVGTPNVAYQQGSSWSVFGQGQYDILDTLEFSIGARYSHEEKTFDPINYLTGASFNTLVPKASWNDISPEVTLTWRPDGDLTTFVSYKEGFLSGGFNGGNGNLALDRTYDQEKVKGFEIGAKGYAFDRDLRFEAAVFRYEVTGMQVSSLVGTTQFITNAADAISEGVELSANWSTPVEGLQLRAGVTYNRAEYDSYPGAPCYGGQTPAQGCTITTSASQDLSGRRIVRAPEWTGSLAASYDVTVWGMPLALSLDGNYTSEIFTEAADNPSAVQDSYWLLDGSARLELSGAWNISFVGKNLTNEYYFQRSVDNPFTGGGTGTNAGVPADIVAAVSRGRELWFRVGYSFH